MNYIIGYFAGAVRKRRVFVLSHKNTVIITSIIDDDRSNVKIESWFLWYHLSGAGAGAHLDIHVTK